MTSLKGCSRRRGVWTWPVSIWVHQTSWTLPLLTKLQRTCQSSKKDLNGPSTPLVLKLASWLPRRLAIRVEQRIQQAQENQREWVTGVLLFAFAAAIVLFLNVVLTIIAASIAYSKAGDQEFTSATLYRGKCSTSKNWVRGLLFLINVLSTIMLAASNYCMQCLSAPSRKIVDNAHTQQKWLDIGVPSMKNLCFVGWRRCILWILLLISSLPIHLMFVSMFPFLRRSCLTVAYRCNSAVFSALGTNEYNALLALADFDIKNPPDHDSAFASCFEKNVAMNMSDFYTQVAHFEELDKQKCI